MSKNKKIIDVDLVINYDYPINANIDSEFIIGDNLNVDSDIRNVCFQGNPNYVAKIISATGQFCQFCYTKKDLTRNELVITKQMSEIGVAPKVYDMALSDTQGVIVMDKYDGTLLDLLWEYNANRRVLDDCRKYENNKNMCLNLVIKSVKQMVEKIHEMGIIHRDIHSENILYKKDGSLAIGDYGLAIYSTSEELRKIDRNFLKRIEEVYKKINKGEIYRDIGDIYFEILYEHNRNTENYEKSVDSLPILKFVWNGVKYPDWT